MHKFSTWFSLHMYTLSLHLVQCKEKRPKVELCHSWCYLKREKKKNYLKLISFCFTFMCLQIIIYCSIFRYKKSQYTINYVRGSTSSVLAEKYLGFIPCPGLTIRSLGIWDCGKVVQPRVNRYRNRLRLRGSKGSECSHHLDACRRIYLDVGS